MSRRSTAGVRPAAAASVATSAHPSAACVSGQATSSGDGWELRRSDCLIGLRALASNSVDAIVTDPPAGIGFMGKDWDSDKGGRDGWVAWLTSVMAECLRVLKPGGHAFVWALPRTSHWTATAIEDARFEIRDVHHHIFGTGFPKSLNVSSVMHELLGVTDGEYGTALKPAVEHWILARKPLDGTYAQNIRAHGVGALNVGAARIGTNGETFSVPQSNPQNRANAISGDDVSALQFHTASIGKMQAAQRASIDRTASLGRWPAHLSLDEYAAALLDEMSGECPSAGSTAAKSERRTEDRKGFEMQQGKLYPERTGGASRFFYVAKGSRAEKDRGLDAMPRRSGGEATGRVDGSAGTKNARAGAGRTGGVRNIHPTVKSIELMRWLVRLVAPRPGCLVLDPFTGSGTTGLGCIAEGMQFLGFERDKDDAGKSLGYFDIATARLEGATRQQVLPLLAMKPTKPEPLQVDLLAGVE